MQEMTRARRPLRDSIPCPRRAVAVWRVFYDEPPAPLPCARLPAASETHSLHTEPLPPPGSRSSVTRAICLTEFRIEGQWVIHKPMHACALLVQGPLRFRL